MKKQFSNPEIEILLFNSEDAILTFGDSLTNGDEDFGIDDL